MQTFLPTTSQFTLSLNPPITVRYLQIIPLAVNPIGNPIGTTLSLKGCANFISYPFLHEAYFSVGSYNVSVTGTNLVSNSFYNHPTFVRYLWCTYPNVDIHSPQTCTSGTNCDLTYPNVLTNYRSVPLVLKSIVTYNCFATQMANYNWSFSYYNASSQQWSNFTETLQQWYISTNGNDSSFWSNFNAYNLRSVTVPNHTMPYGLYQVCLNVSMFGLYPVTDTYSAGTV